MGLFTFKYWYSARWVFKSYQISPYLLAIQLNLNFKCQKKFAKNVWASTRLKRFSFNCSEEDSKVRGCVDICDDSEGCNRSSAIYQDINALTMTMLIFAYFNNTWCLMGTNNKALYTITQLNKSLSWPGPNLSKIFMFRYVCCFTVLGFIGSYKILFRASK